MSLVPDRIPDPRKEDILNHCPFLKMFIKGNISTQEDQSEYNRLHQKLRDDLESRVNGSLDLVVDTEFSQLEQSDLINTQADLPFLKGVISDLILFGYELADINQAKLFTNELLVKLQDIAFLNNDMLVYDLNSEKLILGVINAGINCRTYLHPPSMSGSEEIQQSDTPYFQNDQVDNHTNEQLSHTEMPKIFKDALKDIKLVDE